MVLMNGVHGYEEINHMFLMKLMYYSTISENNWKSNLLIHNNRTWDMYLPPNNNYLKRMSPFGSFS